MNKNVKKVVEINCKSFVGDSKHSIKNSWKGEILIFEDNSCVGYAIERGQQAATHLLVGTFVDGSGLSIWRIHATSKRFSPILFDAFANAHGAKNTYYGQFLMKAFYNYDYYPLGVASIKTKEKSLQKTDTEKIASKYNDMKEGIKDVDELLASSIKAYDDLDYSDISSKIQIRAKSEYNNQLPDVFLKKSASQPGDN